MKRRTRPTRKPRRDDATGVSLFPFLAVLICTMGSLIVLLVIIARQAQLQAAEAVDLEQAEASQQLDGASQRVQLVKSQLLETRSKAAAQLADARLQLGHIEDHTRQLQEELARLQAAAAELENLKSQDDLKRDDLQTELASVQAAIAETEKTLAESRESAAKKRKSFAVVPYKGPRGTYRQPIYIECRKDAVVLQPEEIVLTADDFDGPLGPGNPLEVALRAKREHLLAQRQFDPEGAGEPYPLLLVRPNGIIAYYAARAAMQSWASDFGYELIGDDWELDFPQPDRRLAELMGHAVREAQVRQQLLLAAAPSGYGSRGSGRPKYRAAPYRGGSVLVPGTGNQLPAGSRGTGFSNGFRADAAGDRFGNQYEGESATDNGQAPRPEGTVAGRPPRETDRAATAGGRAARPGEWAPSSDQEGQESPDAALEHQNISRPLAEVRGRNWGLPGAARGSVPITRPIRIDCYHDRLVIPAEDQAAGGKEIPFGVETEDAIETFISTVWERIDSWGIAGQGMYWQPLLKVRVAPGADVRFADLQILLDGSGLEVERKTD